MTKTIEEILEARKNLQDVPYEHPYGSITDDEWICARCHMAITGCALCAGMKVVLRKRRNEI